MCARQARTEEVEPRCLGWNGRWLIYACPFTVQSTSSRWAPGYICPITIVRVILDVHTDLEARCQHITTEQAKKVASSFLAEPSTSRTHLWRRHGRAHGPRVLGAILVGTAIYTFWIPAWILTTGNAIP